VSTFHGVVLDQTDLIKDFSNLYTNIIKIDKYSLLAESTFRLRP
jgi:hypothetical protein